MQTLLICCRWGVVTPVRPAPYLSLMTGRSNSLWLTTMSTFSCFYWRCFGRPFYYGRNDMLFSIDGEKVGSFINLLFLMAFVDDTNSSYPFISKWQSPLTTYLAANRKFLLNDFFSSFFFRIKKISPIIKSNRVSLFTLLSSFYFWFFKGILLFSEHPSQILILWITVNQISRWLIDLWFTVLIDEHYEEIECWFC